MDTLSSERSDSVDDAAEAIVDAVISLAKKRKRLAKRKGLSVEALDTLEVVEDETKIVGDVQHEIDVAAAHMTRVTNRLSEKKLISKKRNAEDERKFDVSIEPDGTNVLLDIRGALVELIAPMLTDSSPEFQRRMTQIMEAIHERCEESLLNEPRQYNGKEKLAFPDADEEEERVA